jgi:mRNA-degrading endonuclease RelE of RelBE toxin-antitoxin system
MRSIRVSQTFLEQLNELLDQGEQRYGRALIEEKKGLVYGTIRKHIALFPASRLRDPDLGLHAYPVTGTPFVLLYDYDDAELRIHFVLHKRADRTKIDPSDIEW